MKHEEFIMTHSQAFPFYYVLAAKGIQEYILRGDKLRLMIGGSELIEVLPGKFLQHLLQNLGLAESRDYRVLSLAAGGARLLFREESAARELARLLPLALSVYAPGLVAVQTVREIRGGLAQTMAEAEQDLLMRRNLPTPTFPVPGPLVSRCPRSGLPAVGSMRSGGSEEPADACMLAKEQALRQARSALPLKVLPPLAFDTSGHLVRRLPDDLEELVHGERGSLALVHIDGNGLGSTLIRLLKELENLPIEEVTEKYSRFSQSVERATRNAVQTALLPIVKEAMDSGAKVFPFRPLICAGDDLTLILRASDAMGFVERFLPAFEENTQREISEFKLPGLQGPLTAAAGIAFVGRNHPFSQAHRLSESLCAYAKEKTGRSCSSVAFWRQTTSASDDFPGILGRELQPKDLCLTMMPYVTGQMAQQSGLPGIGSLQALKQAVGAMPRGSLRGLLSDLYLGKDQALRSFRRVTEVAGGKDSGKGSHAHSQALQKTLAAITGKDPGSEALFRDWNNVYETPLHDAIELRAAEGNGGAA